MTSERRDEVALSDPRALRALAHPARLRIVDELYQGLERTASELAELTELTPSATSYHLRALERWGVIERAEPREDARERPWRAAGRTLSLSSLDAGATKALDVVAVETVDRLLEELRRWSAAEAGETAAWREVATLRRSSLWLTEQEASAFAAELRGLLDRYVGDRDAVRHPADARRIVSLLALVPDVPDQ